MAEEAEVAEVKPCSNPGCDQAGTKSCSACFTADYCGVSCQTADWIHHKEECPGHLRKVGTAHVEKAKGFIRDKNWAHALRHAEIAATKLKQLKDRRLETVKIIDLALLYQFEALQQLNRQKEALLCIKEDYSLWAMNFLRHTGTINAAVCLIQSCIHNKEWEDAEHYARNTYFLIAEMTDSFIPADQRSHYVAKGSYWLAISIHALAESGGIAPEARKKAGEEAIELARKALELHTQQNGFCSRDVAGAMIVLADMLDCFNDNDDDEVPLAYKQAIDIYRRVEGNLSVNVAMSEYNMGKMYYKRSTRSRDALTELDNLEVSLTHFREAARIYGAIHHVNRANEALQGVAHVEMELNMWYIKNTRVREKKGGKGKKEKKKGK